MNAVKRVLGVIVGYLIFGGSAVPCGRGSRRDA